MWPEGRGVWRCSWHLPGGSVATASRALAGGGGSSRRGAGGSSSSSSSRVGQSRKRAAPAGRSMAARPQPGPRTRSRRESSPRAAQPTSGGSWSRPQLQHRRARGGGGEARRRGRGARREGGESEGASLLAGEGGGRRRRRRARGRAGTAGASACGDPALLGAAAAGSPPLFPEAAAEKRWKSARESPLHVPSHLEGVAPHPESPPECGSHPAAWNS